MAAAKLNISLIGYVDYCGYWGGLLCLYYDSNPLWWLTTYVGIDVNNLVKRGMHDKL